jgi:putative ABC transport system permease protein
VRCRVTRIEYARFRHYVRVLLRAYPAKFRQLYGEGLEDAYVDRLASLRQRRTHLALARVAALALFHSLRDGALERLASRPRNGGRRRKTPATRAVLQDLRYTARSFARKPALFAVVMLVFALGIGANTIIFSVVDGVLLRPLPYPESHRLYTVWQTIPEWRESPRSPRLRSMADRMWVSYPVYQDWLEMNRVFESLGIYGEAMYTATGGDRAERISGTRVTHGVFDALAIQPLLGRVILPDDDQIGSPQLAVLSHGLWQRRFGADSAVIGSTMVLDEVNYTIVGVMPRGFHFPGQSELWTTFSDSDRERQRFNQFARCIARLKPGVSPSQAQREMDALAARMNEANPSTYNFGVRLVSRESDVIGNARPALLLLLGAVCVVLLIACANIANLLLVRANERRKELTVRSALGASRGRLLGQLLTESVFLSVIGGAVGLLLAVFCIKPFVATLPSDTPRVAEVVLDSRVLGFSLALSVLTGVLVGILPALAAVRTQLTQVLHSSSRGFAGGRQRNRTQAALLVSEIALTFVLLVGAGLLTKSFLHLLSVNPGFEPENLIALRLSLEGSRYSSDDHVRATYQELYERLQALPGVQEVAAATQMPFSGGSTSNRTTVDTRTGFVESSIERSNVTASYFRVMGIPLIAGRPFTPEDKDSDIPVAIVSQATARTYWPDEQAIGQRFKEGSVDSDSPWITVVGVAGDVRHEGLDVQQYSKIYLPFSKGMTWLMADARVVTSTQTVVLKTALDPAAVMAAARDVVRTVDPDLPIIQMSTLDSLISRSVANPRFRTILIGSLAVLAAVLSMVGVFGVLAYAVSQRTNEIGIRMALGARSAHVVRSVLYKSLMLLGFGIGIGAAVTLAAVRTIQGFLFEVAPLDPGTLLSVALLLTVAAMAASYIPARRATKVDPIAALRQE